MRYMPSRQNSPALCNRYALITRNGDKIRGIRLSLERLGAGREDPFSTCVPRKRPGGFHDPDIADNWSRVSWLSHFAGPTMRPISRPSGSIRTVVGMPKTLRVRMVFWDGSI